MQPKDPIHFEGKTAFDHLKKARLKGSSMTAEIHGEEPPGHLIAACDSAKELVIILSLVWTAMISAPFTLYQKVLCSVLLVIGLIIWKTTRSALYGWARLERLHRLIEEERFEIEHHRPQEKEELLEMYKAKGFKGKQLDDIISVLMADDNRLLMVMLEEELGLSVHSFEHPLKQALGACIGACIAGALGILSILVGGLYMLYGLTFLILVTASILSAKALKNDTTKSVVWHLSIAFLSLGVVYFLEKLIFFT